MYLKLFFCRADERIRKGKAIDAGQHWDSRKKIAYDKPPVVKKRVMRVKRTGLDIPMLTKRKPRSKSKTITGTVASTSTTVTGSSSSTSTATTETSPTAQHSRQEQDQHTGIGTGPSYGINYMTPSFTLPNLAMYPNSTNFGQFTNMNT